MTRRQRYRRPVLPLGFRFEVNAVVVTGVAHREGCDHVALALRPEAVEIPAAGVYRSECCPRECPHCRPPFETLLTFQLE